jgi:hypothetical protein
MTELSARVDPADGAHRWFRRFEDRTIVVQRVHNLPQAEAEREAFQHLVIEYLNETHPNTNPRVCAHCGAPDLPLTPTLPFGVLERHAWLHQRCWAAWRERRRNEAIAVLAAMGLCDPASLKTLGLSETVPTNST